MHGDKSKVTMMMAEPRVRRRASAWAHRRAIPSWRSPVTTLSAMSVLASVAALLVSSFGVDSFPLCYSSRSSPTSSPASPRLHPQANVGALCRRILELTQRNQATALLAVQRTGGEGLRPAAVPLMEAGKHLAVSGERIIEWTDAVQLYGGGISSSGAQFRNAGDAVAQAAASCRFQTGQELVSDELRTAADCLAEAVAKLQFAAEEADIDEQGDVKDVVEACVPLARRTSDALERAGAAIMQNQPVPSVGRCWVDAGEALVEMSACVQRLGGVATLPSSVDPKRREEARSTAEDAARRMHKAGANMVEAGRELQPRKASSDAQPAGKRWLKGGGG